MDEDAKVGLWREFMGMPDMDFDYELHKVSVQPGRSFSEEAIGELMEVVMIFIGTRVMQRWERTNEPPTFMRVSVKVEVA